MNDPAAAIRSAVSLSPTAPAPHPAPAGTATGPPWRTAPGPPVMPSAPARRSAMIARVAIAPPMLAAVNGLPLWPITRRALLQAAVGEQDVAGDHHRLRVGLLRDPVVGGVELVRHQHPLDQRMVGHADARVADHPHRHLAAQGDSIDLVLHRAGVGVDQDSNQARRSSRFRCPTDSPCVIQAGRCARLSVLASFAPASRSRRAVPPAHIWRQLCRTLWTLTDRLRRRAPVRTRASNHQLRELFEGRSAAAQPCARSNSCAVRGPAVAGTGLVHDRRLTVRRGERTRLPTPRSVLTLAFGLIALGVSAATGAASATAAPPKIGKPGPAPATPPDVPPLPPAISTSRSPSAATN